MPPFRDTVIARIAQAEDILGSIVITSQLSRLECRVRALRDGNAELLTKYAFHTGIDQSGGYHLFRH